MRKKLILGMLCICFSVLVTILGLEKNIDYGSSKELQDVPYKKVVLEKEVLSKTLSEGEVYTLAQCVEAEAGVGNTESQKHITQVILNRVASDKFPNSVEEVIFQKRGCIPQFSVAYNGMMNRKVKEETLMNVYKVLMHGTDLPDNVLYFYADFVKDNWVNTLNIYSVVEGTVFAYEN